MSNWDKLNGIEPEQRQQREFREKMLYEFRDPRLAELIAAAEEAAGWLGYDSDLTRGQVGVRLRAALAAFREVQRA